MSRLIACAFTALAVASVSPALAQAPPPAQEPQAELRDLTDVRIDVLKTALQLSSDQTKYWPAIEEAIRARADERRERVESFAARMHEPQPDRNFLKVLQNRADNLSERAAGLKRLADAWQPLYPTLTDVQKRRMRILAAVVLRDAREGMAFRHMQMEDEDAWGAMTGPGSGESGFGRD